MAKILLVEDDSNLREIYGARLEAEGYEVVTASDGEEGLAAAVKERPHLIIADVMMPKISGFDMLDILRTTPETKDVKVIVMTALSQDEDKKRGESLGADRYFVKSQIVLEDLVETVKELLVDVPGGQIELAPGAPSAPVSAPQTSTQSDNQAAATVTTQPVQEPVQPSTPPQNINDDVADFVASSPLMNDPPANAPSDQAQQSPSQQPPINPEV